MRVLAYPIGQLVGCQAYHLSLEELIEDRVFVAVHQIGLLSPNQVADRVLDGVCRLLVLLYSVEHVMGQVCDVAHVVGLLVFALQQLWILSSQERALLGLDRQLDAHDAASVRIYEEYGAFEVADFVDVAVAHLVVVVDGLELLFLLHVDHQRDAALAASNHNEVGAFDSPDPINEAHRRGDKLLGVLNFHLSVEGYNADNGNQGLRAAHKQSVSAEVEVVGHDVVHLLINFLARSPLFARGLEHILAVDQSRLALNDVLSDPPDLVSCPAADREEWVDAPVLVSVEPKLVDVHALPEPRVHDRDTTLCPVPKHPQAVACELKNWKAFCCKEKFTLLVFRSQIGLQSLAWLEGGCVVADVVRLSVDREKSAVK